MEQLQFFSGRGRNGEFVRLPRAYRQKVKWVPHIGDIFPDFDATTTQGPIRFHGWAEGNWTILFSQPGAFTPVCTTELASLARARREFADRNANLIGLTNDEVQALKAWADEVAVLFGTPVDFPLIEDSSGLLARTFGMHHQKESGNVTIRKTFILDPSMRIRMIFEYPLGVGRSTGELLRTLDALQHQDALDVATPADWQPGLEYVLPMHVTAEQADHRFGRGWTEINDYLRVVDPAALVERHRRITRQSA